MEKENEKKMTGGLRGSKGFTLVELSVVIVIIGVLAAFAVPRFRNAVERSKAGEAFNYLSSVATAQERHHSRQGTYADILGKLDIKMSAPKYFAVAGVQPGTSGDLEDSWSLTLSRQGASAGYGAYTVSFTEEGYDSQNSTLDQHPDINPQAT